MTTTPIEPGSGADRFVQHLTAHPGAQEDRYGVARILGISAVAVDAALLPGVEAALITVATDGDMGRVWRAGPRLKLARPASAPTAPKAARRGGRRLRLPALDTTGLAAKPLALPDAALSVKGRTRYDSVFDLLTTDGTAVPGLPMAYRAALQKGAHVYLNNRPALKAKAILTVRRIDDSTCGVWRLPRNPAVSTTNRTATK